MIKRKKDLEKIQKLLEVFPVVAILGPRQCGKTTISKKIKFDHYFDLENPAHLASFDNSQFLLENLDGLVVIDEIQRKPDLFPLIRYLTDNLQKKFLILGSASRELMRQSSESLAGRIGYYYLSGFSLDDVGSSNLEKMWLRGSFPRSYLAKNEAESNLWRENYISTFLERDIPQLGISIPASTLRRFWTMLSHYHGQILNYSELGQSFGISDVTVKKYLNILESTFMVKVLSPWFSNVKKRLVKSPKLYLSDSGIFHSLLSIRDKKQLLENPKLGASWEGFAIDCVSKVLGKRREELYFWSTHSGAEIDLFWQNQGKSWGMEFKFADTVKLTKSMQIAIEDLNLAHLWVVYPGREKYKIREDVTALPLEKLGGITQGLLRP